MIRRLSLLVLLLLLISRHHLITLEHVHLGVCWLGGSARFFDWWAVDFGGIELKKLSVII